MKISTICSRLFDLLKSDGEDGFSIALKEAMPNQEKLLPAAYECFVLKVCSGGINAQSRVEQLMKDGILKRSVCGATWQAGDTGYKCKDCQMDSTW